MAMKAQLFKPKHKPTLKHFFVKTGIYKQKPTILPIFEFTSTNLLVTCLVRDQRVYRMRPFHISCLGHRKLKSTHPAPACEPGTNSIKCFEVVNLEF